jgi:hypothetical protein
MTFCIGRREVITLAARRRGRSLRAQQAAMPIVGFLHKRAPDANASLSEAFRNGLNESGFTD